jgi:hypothetical protein
MQEYRGAFEESRDNAHSAHDTFEDLQLRRVGEFGKGRAAMYVATMDALSDQNRMTTLWERQLCAAPGTSGGDAAAVITPPELHWEARQQLNTVKRWAVRSERADAARMQQESFQRAAVQRAEQDTRRKQPLSKYRV